MLRVPFRVFIPFFALLLFVFSGCLTDPQMPETTSSTAPVGSRPSHPLNDSMAAPVDTISRRPPADTLLTPPPGVPGTLEHPRRHLPEPPDTLQSPPPPPPPSGNVELGLLSDLTSLGTLYTDAGNWWNLEVDNAPLDPNSDEIIQTIEGYEGSKGRMHPDFTPDAGIPYCVVGDETPRVQVELGNASESDMSDPDGVSGYPIPTAANTDLRYVENGGADTGDRHLLIYDRDRREVFELSYAQYVDGKWTAGYGAIFKVDSNYRRPDGWTSTDAAGLCVLAGLVRYDEVYGPEPIHHAIRVSLKRTNGYVWPASHEGASDDGAPPLGMRLRLKASFDLSDFPPEMRKILQAMKTYGLIVADRGGNMYVQGTMDSRWNNGRLNPAFHQLHASDFEVIQLGWRPAS